MMSRTRKQTVGAKMLGCRLNYRKRYRKGGDDSGTTRGNALPRHKSRVTITSHIRRRKLASFLVVQLTTTEQLQSCRTCNLRSGNPVASPFLRSQQASINTSVSTTSTSPRVFPSNPSIGLIQQLMAIPPHPRPSVDRVTSR